MSEDIQWWRDRYNNLVSVMSGAVDGMVVEVSDDTAVFPLSDGAKALLKRVAAQSAERSELITALEKIATGYSKGLKHYEHILVVQEIAKEALKRVSGSPEQLACTCPPSDVHISQNCPIHDPFSSDGRE